MIEIVSKSVLNSNWSGNHFENLTPKVIEVWKSQTLILFIHNKVLNNHDFIYNKHRAKSIMTDAWNPGWETFFENFVATRSRRLPEVPGVVPTTLRFPAKCHDQLSQLLYHLRILWRLSSDSPRIPSSVIELSSFWFISPCFLDQLLLRTFQTV